MTTEYSLRERAIHFRDRAYRMSRAHAIAKQKTKYFSYWMTVPILVLTMISGALAYSGLFVELSRVIVGVIGSVSVFAAILTSLQLFFNFESKSQKHSGAEAQYKLIYRKLSLLSAATDEHGVSEAEILARVESYVDRLGELDSVSPDVPDRYYDQAKVEHINDSEGI